MNYIKFLVPLIFIFFSILIIKKKKGRKKGIFWLPPEELNSAEAGYLLKDNLNYSDVISIIYSWAVSGMIYFEEIDNPKILENEGFDNFIYNSDYRVYKLKEFDESARPYERIFFNYLFTGKKDYFDVSDLKKRGNIETVEIIKIEIEKYLEEKGFFKIKTRKRARKIIEIYEMMKSLFYDDGNKKKTIIKIFVGITLMCSLIIIPYIILMVLMKKIGIKLLRFSISKNGWYQNLELFYKFVKTGKEQDILQYILNEKNYFDKTFTYSIGMELGHKWIPKFKEEVKNIPQWYKGYGNYNIDDFFSFMDKSYYIFYNLLTKYDENIKKNI